MSNLTITEQKIRDFLLEEVLYDKQLADLGPTDLLWGAGMMDSLSVIQTVALCEQMFDIKIPEEEILPDHFQNLRAIGEMIERRLAEKTSES